MKKTFSILFALVLVVSLGLATALPVLAGTIIHVPDDYPTIEAALNASEDGDTIMVAAGEYDAFLVAEKNDISIIGTEGVTVTTANLHWIDVAPIEDAWVMAGVYRSENINIEGINFDGTDIIDEEVVVGIAYVDSTGRITDLTVENIIGNDLGVGVAIIGDVGTSTVEITGSTISNNGIGILVLSDSIQEAHLNNIVGNTDYGVGNDGSEMVDATNNWWGANTGPSGFGPGDGDAVSSNVDFEPWLETEIVSQTVSGYDTIDALDVADIQVVVNGTATVTIARYASNPHPEAPVVYGALASVDLLAEDTYDPVKDMWRDVRASNTQPGTEIEIIFYYTNAQIKDFEEDSLQIFWYNIDEDEWAKCSPDNEVYPGDITIKDHDYNGYMRVKITTESSPSLFDLVGTEFGGYGHPSGTPGGFCFIATAAYGTDTAKEIDILREFRDAVLLPDSLGAKFVSLYYKTSPPIAAFISQHEVLRTAVRVGFVDPIVAILNWSHDLWSARGP